MIFKVPSNPNHCVILNCEAELSFFNYCRSMDLSQAQLACSIKSDQGKHSGYCGERIPGVRKSENLTLIIGATVVKTDLHIVYLIPVSKRAVSVCNHIFLWWLPADDLFKPPQNLSPPHPQNILYTSNLLGSLQFWSSLWKKRTMLLT